jgi:hypothetical protein
VDFVFGLSLRVREAEEVDDNGLSRSGDDGDDEEAEDDNDKEED